MNSRTEHRLPNSLTEVRHPFMLTCPSTLDVQKVRFEQEENMATFKHINRPCYNELQRGAALITKASG
jgi:hypothetical protein